MPTDAIVTAGLAVAVVASLKSVAIVDARPGGDVAIRGAVELDRVGHDACARGRRGVDLQIGVRQRGRLIAQPEQAGELLVGTHGNQVAAVRHPVREHRDLVGRERHLAENRDVVPGEESPA